MKINRAQKHRIGILLIVLIGIVFLFGFLLLKSESKTTGRLISPILHITEEEKVSELLNIFEKHFSNEENNYAIVIKNLKTGEEFLHNEDSKFNSASLYKLWVLAVAKDQIDRGLLNEDDLISSEKSILDERLSFTTSTPVPEGFVPEENQKIEHVTDKVGSSLEKMITISDNYSALLLSNRVGVKNIYDFLDAYKFDDSSYDSPPQTTAGDIAKYYELLYVGEIVNEKSSSEIIDLLKSQEFDDRIPKYLPKNLEVAHKTGELLGAKHDTGIVFTKDGDYIIVVLSQTDNEAVAAEKIAQFSKDVYEYFTN